MLLGFQVTRPMNPRLKRRKKVRSSSERGKLIILEMLFQVELDDIDGRGRKSSMIAEKDSGTTELSIKWICADPSSSSGVKSSLPSICNL